jgi:hypothetical protein
MWLRIGAVIRLGTGLKADALESTEIVESWECNKVPKADLKNAQKAECSAPRRKHSWGVAFQVSTVARQLC